MGEKRILLLKQPDDPSKLGRIGQRPALAASLDAFRLAPVGRVIVNGESDRRILRDMLRGDRPGARTEVEGHAFVDVDLGGGMGQPGRRGGCQRESRMRVQVSPDVGWDFD